MLKRLNLHVVTEINPVSPSSADAPFGVPMKTKGPNLNPNLILESNNLIQLCPICLRSEAQGNRQECEEQRFHEGQCRQQFPGKSRKNVKSTLHVEQRGVEHLDIDLIRW